MPFFIATDVPPWLEVAVAVSLAVLNGVTLWYLITGHPQSTEILPQPLDVKIKSDWATREELKAAIDSVNAGGARFREDSRREAAALREDLNKLVEQLREERSELAAQSEERSVKLHDRINAIVDSVGEIKGELKHLSVAIRRS